MVGNRKLFLTATLWLLSFAPGALAQSTATSVDVFGPAAKAIDSVRMQQSAGILAMVLFTIIAACAFALRSMKIGFSALFLVFACIIWYGGGDIARSMIPTTGTAIAP
jgi:hypothetical protein